ncbi:hypothetical protein PX699_07370 [Sphingobium sp. H39-3-25]|nr:hypothetical protein [Sphingobium arseniciresistens]
MISSRHDGMEAADIDEQHSAVAKPTIMSLSAMTAVLPDPDALAFFSAP